MEGKHTAHGIAGQMAVRTKEMHRQHTVDLPFSLLLGCYAGLSGEILGVAVASCIFEVAAEWLVFQFVFYGIDEQSHIRNIAHRRRKFVILRSTGATDQVFVGADRVSIRPFLL